MSAMRFHDGAMPRAQPDVPVLSHSMVLQMPPLFRDMAYLLGAGRRDPDRVNTVTIQGAFLSPLRPTSAPNPAPTKPKGRGLHPGAPPPAARVPCPCGSSLRSEP